MDAYFCSLEIEEQYMQRCLQLAVLGAGNVAPNPMVGAVLVHDSRIIGEGYHQQFGGPHAEVNCMESVAGQDKQFIAHSSLYVSLEPCAHFGKTPPCTDLIIKNKIPRVIIGCSDSFEQVAGNGIKKLQAAGIETQVGVLENECRQLNSRFFTFHEKKRPYIILKWAQSSNGMIASAREGRTIISNEFTNRMVHKWRTEEASILVGTHTARQDDPALTARLWPGNNPLRLVVDADLKLPLHLKLFDGTVKTVVFNFIKHESADNPIYHRLNREENMVEQIVSALYTMNIQSILVEGGAKLLQSFINPGLWDEARIIENGDMMIGEGVHAPVLNNKRLYDKLQLENDSISFFKNTAIEKK